MASAQASRGNSNQQQQQNEDQEYEDVDTFQVYMQRRISRRLSVFIVARNIQRDFSKIPFVPYLQ